MKQRGKNNWSPIPQCRTRPSYFQILQYVQVSSGLNHYFIVYTDTHTDGKTETHADGHEYSTVAVTRVCIQMVIFFNFNISIQKVYNCRTNGYEGMSRGEAFCSGNGGART